MLWCIYLMTILSNLSPISVFPQAHGLGLKVTSDPRLKVTVPINPVEL